MSGAIFLIIFLAAVIIMYIVLSKRSGGKKPIERQVSPEDRAPRAPSGGTTARTGPVQVVKAAESGIERPLEPLPPPVGWQPSNRSHVEVETLWRLEHVLRDLPDMGRTPIANIDFEMEPREVAMALVSNPFYAAKILKTVNSAAFGLRTRIDSIQRAVTYLGYNQVKNIIFQHVIRSNLREVKTGGEYLDLLGFWKHSHAVSTCVEYILREVLHDTRKLGIITTAALLHDIGWIVFGCYEPENASALSRRLHEETGYENPVQVEEEVFGFNHLVAGKMLAEEWGISKGVSEMIGLHHCGVFGFGEGIDRETAFGAAVLAKAEQLTAEMGFQNPMPEPVKPEVDLAVVLGPEAGKLKAGSDKLAGELEKTMMFIDEFQKGKDNPANGSA